MSILRGIFRHHEEDVWRQLSEGVDGDFIHEKGWRNDRVICKAGEWIIVVDLHTTVGYKSEHVSTRFHTTLPNPDKFNFTVHHKNIFERVAHFFGSHDIHLGDEVFDKEYEVRANREDMVKQLLANEQVRTIIKTEPTLSLRLGTLYAIRGPDALRRHVYLFHGFSAMGGVRRIRDRIGGHLLAVSR